MGTLGTEAERFTKQCGKVGKSLHQYKDKLIFDFIL